MFGSPHTYKDWYIFPDTTLDNIRLDDCPSSVTGTCENTKTIEECIQICQDNQPCFAGYFIETPDQKNICVPIRKISGGPSIGPYYRLRNKNMYKELQGLKSSVFTSQIYKYPPDHGNNIFYTDKFVLTNLSAGKSIGLSDRRGVTDTLTNTPVYIQFLPKEIFRSYITQYLIVKNGDEVIINIPNTAYILKDNPEGISWVLRLSSLEEPNNTFRVFSTDKNKKIGDLLNYQDILYFTSQDRQVVFDKNSGDLITATNNNPEASSMYFKPTPKIRVYYCESGQCKNVMLEQTDMDQEKARYKGLPVSRSPSCWGCHKKKKYWWIVIPIILVFAVIIFVFRKKLFPA